MVQVSCSVIPRILHPELKCANIKEAITFQVQSGGNWDWNSIYDQVISCPTDLCRLLPLPGVKYPDVVLPVEENSSPLVPSVCSQTPTNMGLFVFVVSIYLFVLCPTVLVPAGRSGCRTRENLEVTECPLVAKLCNLNHCKFSQRTCAGKTGQDTLLSQVFKAAVSKKTKKTNKPKTQHCGAGPFLYTSNSLSPKFRLRPKLQTWWGGKEKRNKYFSQSSWGKLIHVWWRR